MSHMQLGIPPESDSKRDAVHVAVVPVEAGEVLNPGQRVSMRYGTARSGGVTIGIVDPFLREPVAAGSLFWLVVDPATVKNLRHDWDHDDLPHPGSPEAEVDDGCRGC